MPLLSVDDLSVHFRTRRGLRRRSGAIVRAVDGVSLDVDVGQTVALVGESGCGKTTVARAVLGLVKPTSGQIVFGGEDLSGVARRWQGERRGQLTIVFQDPTSSLDPRMTVRDIVAEPLRAKRGISGRELSDRVLTLLEMVGMGTQHLWRRPHEFSGGQCQRIAIARALALEPRLVVLDEPTSALDVSVQSRILVLLEELRERLGLAYLFITHDLAVVESMASEAAVMYLGRIIELGPVHTLFATPYHPYTAALLASVPSPDPDCLSGLAPLEGDVPSPVDLPRGCRFHPRCRFVAPVCIEAEPELRRIVDGDGVARHVACHLAPTVVVQEKAIREGQVTLSDTAIR